jgi:beta-glucosidase
VWPPYLRGVDGWLRLLPGVARGVASCTHALRAADPRAIIISADCDFTPPFDTVAAATGVEARPLDAREQLIHDTFAGMLAYGAVPETHPTLDAALRAGLPEGDVVWLSEHADRPDIVGYNTYPDFAKLAYDDAARRLETRLRLLHEHLGLPVYLTETSAGATDEEKTAWIGQLSLLRDRARASGFPLRGVNWWPLYETVQWFYRDNGKQLSECIVPGGWNNGLYRTLPDLTRVATGAVEARRRFCAA